MKKLFLWTEIVAYIFWEDWQPGRDDPEKLAFFLFSDAGDFVPYSRILLLSLLFLAFSSASLEKNDNNQTLNTFIHFKAMKLQLFYFYRILQCLLLIIQSILDGQNQVPPCILFSFEKLIYVTFEKEIKT